MYYNVRNVGEKCKPPLPYRSCCAHLP